MIPLTELLIKEDITQIPALSVLIRFIIVKYYARYYSFCSIGQDFLTDVTIARITLDATASDMSNRNLQLAIDIGCQAFVVEEPGILWFLDHYIPAHHNSQQRSKDKSVMLLIKKRNSDTLLKLISQHVSLRGTPIVYLVFLEYIRCITILINSNLILDIFNVLIIVYNPENLRPDRLYTTVISFTGVQQHNLDHRTSLRIIEVDWINWKLTQFFPDKLTDLQGFVLRLGTFNYLPFSYYERMDPGLGNAYDADTGERSVWLDGTELRLLVSFCQWRNCNIIVFTEDEDELGVVYANGSGKGILGDVAEGRTDLALGAVYYWFGPYNFTDYTMSISRSGVTMLVPRPHMLPFWYTPFLSFSPVLWAAVFCTLLTGIGAAWYIGYFRYRLLTSFNMERQNVTERLSLSEAILMVVGFFVAQSASIRNDLWSCVVLFASLLLAGFMVSNCYSAGLASVMTIPQYEHSIDTVIDFANSGMQWISPTAIVLEGISGGTEVTVILAESHHRRIPHMKKIASTMLLATGDRAIEYARRGQFGFIIERAQHGDFAPSNHLEQNTSILYQKLLDDLYYQNCAAISIKTNPLLANLNDYILRVQQSGILYYWANIVAMRYQPTGVFRNIENARHHNQLGDGAVRLQIDHFIGAFFILGYGLLCAGFIFLLEVSGTKMVGRLKRRVRSIRC
uniref:Ionotropic glutamate receptor C-terminal domain-containing protein n=1 Tax=Anopheles albimanus TaxID=7167 RepID=A0A182FQ68_ANOAL